MRIILERPDGSRYTVAPGARHPGDHRAVGIEKDGADLAASQEEADTLAMLGEIERELGPDKGTSGDWVKFFAKPIAHVLNKDDCLSCEFRRVCLDAGKKLRKIHGPAEGKKKMMDLITRSFTDDAGRLAAELRSLLEQ
jgi:hypothetical protein